MSKIPTKRADQSLNFEGFLKGLHGWDPSPTDTGKNPKTQVSHKGKSKIEFVAEEKQPARDTSSKFTSNSTSKYRSMDYDSLSQMSSGVLAKDSTVDATSEKDLGNEYYKKKKFNEAIDCYSRSIALSPTAVAYANRAICYLKTRRFQEAEDDCTEALNLDDRYIKAYSRRATARKEIGKLGDSLEDVEFALRLEPQSEELKKQRAEVKSLLEKAILAKAARTVEKPPSGVKEVDAHDKDKLESSVPSGSKKLGMDALPGNKQVFIKESNVPGNTIVKNKTLDVRQQINGHKGAPNTVSAKDNKASKELDTSIQELASRAASRAAAEAAKHIVAPSSAYQFEVTWRGFSGDHSLQSRLLKVTPPEALPTIFKNALTAPVLVDIIKCLATLFTEEMELVVKYLVNLAKVPRFGMIILCLSSADKADLHRIWNEVFLSNATPIELAESLSELHPRYCPQ